MAHKTRSWEIEAALNKPTVYWYNSQITTKDKLYVR